MISLANVIVIGVSSGLTLAFPAGVLSATAVTPLTRLQAIQCRLRSFMR